VQLHVPPRRGSRLLGVGAYRPRRVVTNAELCVRIDSTPDWIESRSGIRCRRFASADETLATMAAAAGREAVGAAGLTADHIDCLLVATTSDLVQVPQLSARVARELALTRAGGFDVLAACAGFCHAVGVASDLVTLGQAEHVLVVGVERMTDIVGPTDRTTAFLFADGAGAAVVGPSATAGIGPVARGLDICSTSALRMTADVPAPVLAMDGRRVFRWAVDEGVPACRRALKLAGVDLADLAAFVPHQANLRIIDVLAAKLGLPDRVVVARDVVRSGNTSAASVPLALAALLRDGAVRSGDPALLFGFGAGLNYAAEVVLVP
jgi:3-oxoacyl-(acyl-carrier-protein) synthase III